MSANHFCINADLDSSCPLFCSPHGKSTGERSSMTVGDVIVEVWTLFKSMSLRLKRQLVTYLFRQLLRNTVSDVGSLNVLQKTFWISLHKQCRSFTVHAKTTWCIYCLSAFRHLKISLRVPLPQDFPWTGCYLVFWSITFISLPLTQLFVLAPRPIMLGGFRQCILTLATNGCVSWQDGKRLHCKYLSAVPYNVF